MEAARKPKSTTARRKDGLITTGDMARLSRSTLRTVRFYEEAGLLHPVQRTEGGHRLFATSELRRLRLISDLRAAGFALEEIRELLATKEGAGSGPSAARAVNERLDEQIKSMAERAELLTRLVAELSATRALLDRCTRCTHAELFPHSCATCEVVSDASDVPDAAKVLWNLGR